MKDTILRSLLIKEIQSAQSAIFNGLFGGPLCDDIGCNDGGRSVG